LQFCLFLADHDFVATGLLGQLDGIIDALNQVGGDYINVGVRRIQKLSDPVKSPVNAGDIDDSHGLCVKGVVCVYAKTPQGV
jgi:hypothetical protein